MGLLRTLSFLYVGNKNFTRNGYLRAAAHFDDSIMQRSLEGKTVAITGANSGIGFAAAKEIAKRGCKLLMLCRSDTRGAEAVAAVRAESGNSNVHLEVVDVSSLASVAAFADRFVSSGQPLHVLVNNAGVLLNERQTSADGHDLSFATNNLGTLALTQRLLPALKRGAPSKVVFVASGGMYTECLELDDLNHTRLNPWDGSKAYAQDKRRQVALAEHLASLWASSGVQVYSMHPGWADTEGVRTSIPGFHRAFQAQLRSPAEGADTIVWLALAEPAGLRPGGFYLDRAAQAKDLALAGTVYSAQQAAALYEALLEMAGLAEGGAS